ncbi:hypothetical protein ElyMa_001210400 [Elysia marginata]|uniref:G-protein coupled receptors family 1 profile domain-containing protein n=1 Tax=Elysia marginata TaxID=1093978 RepID=A0AAV4IA23_9GAST|nr:hypothetical protein ElyMa_001210400 [Elysia marginata]
MNESLELSFTEAPTPAQLRRYVAEFLITITVLSYIRPAIIFFGLVTNVINLVVFLKAGAKDNVTIVLMALACSDLVFLALISTHACGFLLIFLVKLKRWPFDPLLLVFFAALAGEHSLRHLQFSRRLSWCDALRLCGNAT